MSLFRKTQNVTVVTITTFKEALFEIKNIKIAAKIRLSYVYLSRE